MQLNGEYVIETFDITSLYTNVSTEDAVKAVYELVSEHRSAFNLNGFIVGQIMTFLKECLNCGIFRWSGRYYKQVCGAAMGRILAPVIAIVFISKIERPIACKTYS
ncbi:unnamed protein product [Cylicostephanus goldi]|uniref:Reverse transcriptase domain-containing protein n=1 Tax=Cylicostephanus goldi TaxID=71465 RepID=A0A3P6RLJ1_CYLGO|nr:unnamed protein product [Cylicostephanus goldi]